MSVYVMLLALYRKLFFIFSLYSSIFPFFNLQIFTNDKFTFLLLFFTFANILYVHYLIIFVSQITVLWH